MKLLPVLIQAFMGLATVVLLSLRQISFEFALVAILYFGLSGVALSILAVQSRE